jgi:hypothetical protein
MNPAAALFSFNSHMQQTVANYVTIWPHTGDDDDGDDDD